MKKFSSLITGIWIPLGIGAAVVVLVSIAGNVLVIGSKLAAVHPWLEMAFYILLVLLFGWVLYYPVRMFMAPVITPGEMQNLIAPGNEAGLRKAVRHWVSSGVFKDSPLRDEMESALRKGGDLRPFVAGALEQQRKVTREIINRHATLVFVSTALCQNGSLDAIVVISTNFRMIGEIIRVSGYRPRLPRLARLYAYIFMSGLVANQIDDIAFETAFGTKAASLIGGIPGLTLAVRSAMDGGVNSLLTLRIGYIARRCLIEDGLAMDKSALRRAANANALKELPSVAKNATMQLPSAFGKILSVVFGWGAEAGGGAPEEGDSSAAKKSWRIWESWGAPKAEASKGGAST